MTPRWLEGIWLGKRFSSEEHVVSMPDGKVVRTRAVQSVAEELQWNKDMVLAVSGLPWAPTGTLTHPTFTIPRSCEKIVEPEVVYQVIPRGVTIRERHLEKFGFTSTCRKCQSMQGLATAYSTIGHTKECRERVVECIGRDPEMKAEADAAVERKTRYLEKEVERNDVKKQKTDDAPPPVPLNIEEAQLTGGSSGSGANQPVLDQDLPIVPGDEVLAEGDLPMVDASGEVSIDQSRKRGRDDDEEERDRAHVFRSLPPEDLMEGRAQHPLGVVQKREPKYLVSEAFSPPRVAARARDRKLAGGWSFEILGEDPVTKRKWDLSDEKEVQRAKHLIRKEGTHVLIMSPPCTLFSLLQSMNKKFDESEYQRAVKLFLAAIELCELQRALGRTYVLEHPQASRAWKLREAVALMAHETTLEVNFHMCGHGMTSRDEHGEGLVFKPTKVLTNSPSIAEKVNVRCCGGHRHVQLTCGRANAAAIYPQSLCDRIIDGALIDVMADNEKSKSFLGNLMSDADVTSHDMCDPLDGVENMIGYMDSRTGELLNDDLVGTARAEEMRIFNEMNVYSYATEEEMRNTEGAKMIGTTWVDVNKGTMAQPEYRSRLCGQEFAKGDPMDDLFAATPPLQGIKLMVSMCASEPGKRLMILDVKRAFLYGKVTRPIFTKLPREDPRFGEPGIVWRLEKAMYGTRDAPAIWQREVRRVLCALGFVPSKYNTCIYRHKERDVVLNVHVDDFLCLANSKEMKWLEESLAKNFLLKKEILGPGATETRTVNYLGREIRWTNEGLEYEADSKHVQILLQERQMTGCRGVVSPGIKEVSTDDEEPLDAADAHMHRRAAARLNYLAQDRMDIAYATKELARHMSIPCPSDVVELKRMLRYLKSVPRSYVKMNWQHRPTEVVAYVDRDWAGCLRTRRSTSGGALMHGSHCVGHWSRTQSNVALSSGEAELNSALKGGVELKGCQTLFSEMGRVLVCRMKGDSTACTGILSREGAGKLKHVEVKQLWLQEFVSLGLLKVTQIPRLQNIGDAFTKHWGPDAEALFAFMNLILLQRSQQQSACSL